MEVDFTRSMSKILNCCPRGLDRVGPHKRDSLLEKFKFDHHLGIRPDLAGVAPEVNLGECISNIHSVKCQ